MSEMIRLDQKTVNQIAAGEVIERPAAVVKELVENSVDAGASAITVEIKEGGMSVIRVTDNGTGIPKDEVHMAFLPHTTSKIKTAEDLFRISSLGFRGEALASIASVSQVEFITKVEKEMTGLRYRIEGGVETGKEEIGCPNGSTLLVRNLFYNTPARRKFLKSPTAETSYINDFIERTAVCHPEISFKFLVSNQLKLSTSGNHNRKETIYHIYGREIVSNLIEIAKKEKGMEVVGFIGKPVISRGTRNYENYFVNGRYIKSTVISRAIEDAYQPYSMLHRYPFTVLCFTIDSSQIDVNVHPTKMEIRLEKGDEIYRMTYEAIREALSSQELIPELAAEKNALKAAGQKQKNPSIRPGKIPEPFETVRREEYQKQPTNRYFHEDQKNWEGSVSSAAASSKAEAAKKSAPIPSVVRESLETIREGAEAVASVLQTGQNQQTLWDSEFFRPQAIKECSIIGQIFSTYWIVEYQNKVFFIDQHAAHEKVLYEKTIKRIRTQTFDSQILFPPFVISLPSREQEALQQMLPALQQLGFEIEAFGGNEYSIHAVPSDFFGLVQENVLLDMVDQFVESEHSKARNISFPSLLERIASFSCKAAVKGNHNLSKEEAEALLLELLQLENPYHCPHGRPTILSISRQELEKYFKRIL